jgi:hypothetical protein
MLKLPPNNQRTDPELERQVVTLIARGDRYANISHDTGVPVPTIKKIKRRNLAAIIEIEHRVVEWQAKTARRMLQKSYTQLERELDRALAGEIDIGIRELVAISREMFKQVQVEETMPAATVGSPASMDELETLLRAIKTDDSVEMKRIIFASADTR